MIDAGLMGVEFVAVDAEVRFFEFSKAHKRIQDGQPFDEGARLGRESGSRRRAAEEDADLVAETLAGADMVFVTAGMGGGTGTGAAPAGRAWRASRERSPWASSPRPFTFEGKRRHRQALEGIIALKQEVDTLIIIQNDELPLDRRAEHAAHRGLLDGRQGNLHATKGVSNLCSSPRVS